MVGGQQAVESSIDHQSRQLFEKNSIPKIRVVLQNTRRDVEQKRQELRKLVGARYRDLIDSADTIIEMKNSASSFHRCISEIDEKCEALSRVKNSAGGAATLVQEKETERSLRRRKHHLSKQIKHLVDTPEKIWSNLENFNYYKATNLYLQAQETHFNLLKDKSSAHLLASIPLLGRQWTTIEQFPSKIKNASRGRLLQNGLGKQDYAGSCYALILLDGQTPTQAFNSFLSARRTAISNLIQAVVEELKTNVKREEVHIVQSISNRMCELIETVQWFLFHIYEIFCVGNKPDELSAPPLLYSMLSLNKVQKENIPMENIQIACQHWLQKCSQLIKEGVEKILGHVNLAKNLAAVQLAVWNQLVVFGSESAERKEHVSPLNPLNPLTPSPSSEILPSTSNPSIKKLEHDRDEKTVVVSIANLPPWKQICTVVANGPLDLWSSVFKDVFSKRSKEIISFSLQNASVPILSHMEKCLIDFNRSASEDRNIGGYIWKDLEEERLSRIKNKANAQTSSVVNITNFFESSLLSSVSDLENLMDDSNLPLSEDHQSLLNHKQSIMELKEYLQETCFLVVTELVLKLEAKLKSIKNTIENELKAASSQASDSQKAKTQDRESDSSQVSLMIDKALFIGRICQSISCSEQLRKVFVQESAPIVQSGSSSIKNRPSKTTRDNSKMRTSGTSLINSNGTIKTLDDNPHSKKLKKAFKTVYFFAHLLWVNYTTEALGYLFHQNVQSDNWADSSRKRVWEEMKISVEDDGKTSEETILMPSQSSSYVVSFLFTLCQEVHRIGGHSVDKVVLQYLLNEVSDKVVGVYDRLVTDKFHSIPREGSIQLLFDIYFIFDILSGRSKEDPELAEVLQQYGYLVGETPNLITKQKIDELKEKIQNQIDPIDIAFYEPHLIKNVQRSYTRSAVLLGPLIQLNRLYSTMKQKAPGQEMHNILCLAAPTSRFPYLPISADPQTSVEKTKESVVNPLVITSSNYSDQSVVDPYVGNTASGISLSFMSEVGKKLWSGW